MSNCGFDISVSCLFEYSNMVLDSLGFRYSKLGIKKKKGMGFLAYLLFLDECSVPGVDPDLSAVSVDA